MEWRRKYGVARRYAEAALIYSIFGAFLGSLQHRVQP
jgi:hypothetical protein